MELKLLKNIKGNTFISVIVCIAIVVILVTSLSLDHSVSQAYDYNKNKTIAIYLAQEMMETVDNTPFNSIVSQSKQEDSQFKGFYKTLTVQQNTNEKIITAEVDFYNGKVVLTEEKYD